MRCAACGRAISSAGVLHKPSGIGYVHVCAFCQLRLTGSFFAPGPVSRVTHCLLGHPVPHEDSPRVGWVRCPTCQASLSAAWAGLAAANKLPLTTGSEAAPAAKLDAAGQYLLF